MLAAKDEGHSSRQRVLFTELPLFSLVFVMVGLDRSELSGRPSAYLFEQAIAW